MDFNAFLQSENDRASKREAALAKAIEKRDAAIAKANEDFQAALTKAEDEHIAGRDRDEGAFNDARRKEREAIVEAANLNAGIDRDGKPSGGGKTQKKKAQ